MPIASGWNAAMAGLAIALAAAAWTAPAAAGVRSTVVKRDYHVAGETPRRLVAYMRNAPLRGHFGGAALASIVPSYRLDLATAQKGRTCRVQRLDLNVTFTLTLPRARDEARMSRTTRSAWRNFVSFARRHEETHRKIYLGCASRFVAKARKLTADSCWTLQSEIRALQRSEEAACERRNAAFDRKEYKRVPRLTLFRLAKR